MADSKDEDEDDDVDQPIVTDPVDYSKIVVGPKDTVDETYEPEDEDYVALILIIAGGVTVSLIVAALVIYMCAQNRQATSKVQMAGSRQDSRIEMNDPSQATHVNVSKVSD